MTTTKNHSDTGGGGQPTPASSRTLVVFAIISGSLLVVLFIVGFLIHHEHLRRRQEISREDENRTLEVAYVEPQQTQHSFDLELPADVQPYASTALYARTAGFLAAWKYDINDRVRKGDVMAVISAPDSDADLEQAEANLNQQKTNEGLAAVTEQRYQGLLAVQGVTQQQLDQFHSAHEQASASVVSAGASVDRMRAIVGFERIVAPFDGIVTARNYDVGALISPANTAKGQELFDVEEDDRLRVFVNVPQPYALMVAVGQTVTLDLKRNYPGYAFTGRVARSAGSLDPATRTLRTELDFDNADAAHRIIPGMYAEAVFQISRPEPVLTVPTSALMFEPEGEEVAVVGGDSKIHLRKIVPGSDFGTEIEVLSGVGAGDRIVANPGEQMAEGLAVKAVPAGQAPGQQAGPGQGPK
ncbi:MAG TPA: efflux RND transporter periplasmic adaptor subunit [Opitutaceae bacterium]